MRRERGCSIVLALGLGLALSGCESLDLDSVFNAKKPLAGERKAVFPAGVPGVPQGVPPEMVQGYTPPAEPEPPPPEPEPPKAKPKPKPKPPVRTVTPARPAGTVTVRPAGAEPPPGAAPAPAAWPESPRVAASPARPGPAWPDPPKAGAPAPAPWPDPPPAR